MSASDLQFTCTLIHGLKFSISKSSADLDIYMHYRSELTLTYHASPVLWWGVNLILYATGSFFPSPLSTPYHASPVLWWGVNLILYATGSFFPSPLSTPYHASPVLWWGVNLILYARGSFFSLTMHPPFCDEGWIWFYMPQGPFFPYHASPVLWWGVNLILYATGSFFPLPCIPRSVMRGEFDSICYRVLFSLTMHPPFCDEGWIWFYMLQGPFFPYHASPVLWWGVNLILYATGSFFPLPCIPRSVMRGEFDSVCYRVLFSPYHASPVLWWGVNLILYATGSFFLLTMHPLSCDEGWIWFYMPQGPFFPPLKLSSFSESPPLLIPYRSSCPL